MDAQLQSKLRDNIESTQTNIGRYPFAVPKAQAHVV